MAEPEQWNTVANVSQRGTRDRRSEDPSFAHLFPLDLTPFEQYLLLDDLPHQPMVAFMQVVARTPMERSRLEEALFRANQRNPLYASFLERSQPVWRWHFQPQLRPRVYCMQEHPPLKQGRLLPIDLTCEAGVRTWHYQSPDGRWPLLFQFHHACADGLGMRRYIIDVLISYARLCATDDDRLQTKLRMDRLDPERLLTRGCLKHLTDTPPAVPLTTWQRWVNSYYFFCKPPVPLRGSVPAFHAEKSGDSSAGIQPENCNQHGPVDQPMIVRVLDLNSSTSILDRARLNEVGMNELGMALLFHRCRLWNEAFGQRGIRKRIRLLMPFDIRCREDLRLSAANRLSYSFMGRTHRQCLDWAQLLPGVGAEIRRIKDSRVYLDFIQGMALSQQKPRLFRLVLKGMRNVATAVFTYGGDANRGLSRIFACDQAGYMRIGDTLIEDGIGTPPVRHNTNIAMGFGINHDQVTVAVGWNRQVLTYDDACQFIDGYMEALITWGNTGHPQGT